VDRNVPHRGEMKNTYKITVGKPEGKRPRGSPGCIWEIIIQGYVKNKVFFLISRSVGW
jgi:hypothetical protein